MIQYKGFELYFKGLKTTHLYSMCTLLYNLISLFIPLFLNGDVLQI